MQLPHCDAGVAVRAGAAEVRVRDELALLVLRAAEEDPDRGRVERVLDAELLGDLQHDVVGRRVQRVLDDAEHPLRLVVVRRQLAAPVGDVAPLRVPVERVERLVERVGVDQRATADAGPGHDQRVADRLDPLDAVAADLGPEEVALEVEGGLREVLVLEARSGLEHADAVALLGQPERRDRAAEARADDEDVEVVVGHGRRRRPSRVRELHALPSQGAAHGRLEIHLPMVRPRLPPGSKRSAAEHVPGLHPRLVRLLVVSCCWLRRSASTRRR